MSQRLRSESVYLPNIKVLRYNNEDGDRDDTEKIVFENKIQDTEWHISGLILYMQFEVIQRR